MSSIALTTSTGLATPIAITAGEPAGIGPDLCIQLAQVSLPVEWVVIADPELLRLRAQQLNLEVKIERYDAALAPSIVPVGTVRVVAVDCPQPDVCGKPDVTNVDYLLGTLRLAVRGCIDGRFAAMVTGPLHKGIINDAGVPFSGHTEFLADESDTEQVVMMLTTEGLRVALVTTHLPLIEISAAITPKVLEGNLRIVENELKKYFGIKAPRILVCGLNPHAGEGGHLGTEEQETIIPVMEKLRAEGLQLQGPLPADTAFIPPRIAAADVVVAMYHDQGLPVLKHLGFGHAVNITLGLPFIRTSVDHGTAFDLAGKGGANIGSLQTAITTAIEMRRHQGITE
ncbi:4-hydroxythreonine-4-phosphate dehydrogenase [hydrothermal vent metagenome]|uniref:4-hydroxythreonine-4-phosphate dehydrogenase n=1 Tax=hydrothermal vent metagenome TaxID=652676 RepID=A0A3B0ZSW6_9ZZZZ